MDLKSFFNRRELFKLIGLTGLTSILLSPRSSFSEEKPAAESVEMGFVFFTAEEVAFIKSYVDILIPADEFSPSASSCGVANFIDRQLSGSFGVASRTYLQGPFYNGSPSQGYQKPFTPSEIYRKSIHQINEYCQRKYKLPFDMIGVKNQQRVVDRVHSNRLLKNSELLMDFSKLILQNTKEGFFADPVYFGNKNKVSWKMIGYPGVLALYSQAIKKFKGKKYSAPVYSIEDID